MTSARTAWIMVVQVVVMGLLAGLDFDRTLVAMPAWQRVGAVPWAEFSRHADLGPGIWLYSIEAVGGLLLAIASTASARFDGAPARSVFYVLVVSLLGSIGGLVATVFAAPVMLSIAGQQDPAALAQALDAFHLRGDIRGLFQIVAFVAAAVALGVASRRR